MGDLKAVLEPLLTHPPSPPPLGDIAGRARRRKARRFRVAAAAVVVGLGGVVTGVARLAQPDAVELGPGDAPEPPAASATTTAPSTTDTTGSTSTPPAGEPVLSSTIEDTAVGTDAGTVEYSGGSWTQCGGCDVPTDDSSYRYAYEAGDSYTVRFEGVQLKVFAPSDLHGGVAEVTLDGAAAATPTVDFLTPASPTTQLMWDSGLLADGEHAVTFTIRPGDVEVVLFDRADVYTSPDGTTPPPDEPPAPPEQPPAQPPAGAAPGLLGAGVHDPYEFASWLGRPVDIWETWLGHSWGDMEGVPTLHQYMTGEGTAPFNVRWTGEVSIGLPMWASGENAGTCNSGANDGHMTAVAGAIAAAGFPDAYLRLGWEMDGSWFGDINGAWQDPAGWVQCWRRWHSAIKSVSPDFKLVWNPNFESNTGAGGFDVRTVWPGDEYVDAAGPDYYDWNFDPDATSFNGAPKGINRWVEFVVNEHHKPFVMPEWGLNTPNGGGDDPAFVNQVFDVLDQLKAGGNLAYASYFSLSDADTPCVFEVHVNGCNPASSEAYRTRARAF